MHKFVFLFLFILFVSTALSAQEVQKEFFDDAKTQLKSEITLIDGKREGSAKTYFSDGKVKQEATFKNNKKEGAYIEHYENGNKKIECTYQDGFLTGIYKEYHENGNLKLLTRYYKQKDTSKEAPAFLEKKANILTFTEFQYYDDGQTVRRKTNMAFYRIVKDQPDGSFIFDSLRVANGTETYYLKDGSVEYEKEYDNDRRHAEKVFFYTEIKDTQLITDGGKVASITYEESLPE